MGLENYSLEVRLALIRKMYYQECATIYARGMEMIRRETEATLDSAMHSMVDSLSDKFEARQDAKWCAEAYVFTIEEARQKAGHLAPANIEWINRRVLSMLAIATGYLVVQLRRERASEDRRELSVLRLEPVRVQYWVDEGTPEDWEEAEAIAEKYADIRLVRSHPLGHMPSLADRRANREVLIVHGPGGGADGDPAAPVNPEAIVPAVEQKAIAHRPLVQGSGDDESGS